MGRYLVGLNDQVEDPFCVCELLMLLRDSARTPLLLSYAISTKSHKLARKLAHIFYIGPMVSMMSKVKVIYAIYLKWSFRKVYIHVYMRGSKIF